MTDWITSEEASVIMGVSCGSVCYIARKKGWKIKKRRRAERPYGRQMYTFDPEDVATFVSHREKVEANKSNRSCDARALVKWADGLKSWPTDAEIEARVTERYRYVDIVSVLENRAERQRGFKWCKEES